MVRWLGKPTPMNSYVCMYCVQDVILAMQQVPIGVSEFQMGTTCFSTVIVGLDCLAQS